MRSSTASIFSSSEMMCFAIPTTWLREGTPSPASVASICCSAAFFAGPA